MLRFRCKESERKEKGLTVYRVETADGTLPFIFANEAAATGAIGNWATLRGLQGIPWWLTTEERDTDFGGVTYLYATAGIWEETTINGVTYEREAD